MVNNKDGLVNSGFFINEKPAVNAGPIFNIDWGVRRGSNPWPPEPQSGALPTELRTPKIDICFWAYNTTFFRNCKP